MDGRNPISVSIGTAGYAWPGWVGEYYPESLPHSQMLEFHAAHFPFIEIHSTFLRVPTSAQAARILNSTPDSFQFVLKVPHSASHEHGVRDLSAFRRAADEFAARRRLAGLILELPETFSDTRGHRAWLMQLAGGLGGHPAWVEFRHRSWLRPRLGEWLREHGLRLATVDGAESENGFPRGVFDLNERDAYIRLHAREAKRSPTDAAILEWIDRMRNASPRLERIHIAFNDCSSIEGLQAALRMQELIRDGDSILRLIEPSSAHESVQGLLFQPA